jgi:hypothetical protein
MESTPIVGMAELSQNSAAPTSRRALAFIFGVAVLGPLAAGVAYDQIMPGAPYWLGSLLFVVALLMLLRIKPYSANHV